MSRFLRFLAERHLEGSDNQLKESVIAVEVFGRRPDHDPSQDSIVLTETSRLRSLLAEFYLGEGRDDGIVVEVPKGGYIPVFRLRDMASQPAPPGRKTRQRVWLVAAAVAIGLATGAIVWSKRRNACGETPSGKRDLRP